MHDYRKIKSRNPLAESGKKEYNKKGRNEIRIAYVLKQEDLERAMDLLALGIRKYNETH